MNINKDLLQYLNSFAENPFIEQIVYIFADLPIFFLPLFLVGTWLYYSYFSSKNNEKIKQEKQNLLLIFYSCLLGISITLIIQQFIQIDRPESVIENSGKLLLRHIPDASFPSDHSTMSFSFLVALFMSGYKKIGVLFLPFVLVMNIGRVIAGIHWPFDILAGLIVGILSAVVVFKILQKNKFVKKTNLLIIKIACFLNL